MQPRNASVIAAEISELEAELADSTDSSIARWIRYRLVLLNRELIQARKREFRDVVR